MSQTGKASSREQAMEGGTKKLTILLADDDEDYWNLVRKALGNRLVELRCVRDGVELMDCLQAGGKSCREGEPSLPDLILLDLKMPRKDGREALTEINADPLLSSIPLIVLTVSEDEGDLTWCYSMGANGYLVKPCSFEELSKALGILCTYWTECSRLPVLSLNQRNRCKSLVLPFLNE
jgi:CheY-like chemotaxis protein